MAYPSDKMRVYVKASEPIRRMPEIEEITNLYFIHPIAGYLTLIFAKLHLTPNAVSLTGMLLGILAGAAYYHYRDPRCAIAGFALMVAWHIMDGADGQLARLTRSQSQSGKIIDGICDYVTFIAVYTALGIALSRTLGGWVWGLVVGAGLCHAVQAAAYELQRQEYLFWGWDRKSAELSGLDDVRMHTAGTSSAQRLLNTLYRLYVRIQWQVAGVTLESRQELAIIIQREPEQARLIRQHYREIFAPSVRQWAMLSSNYRTFGIFIAALLKAPQYYFWFEIIGFSAITIVLVARQRARYELFFDSLKTTA
jgi:phosphatidylglycerophosphate synthase